MRGGKRLGGGRKPKRLGIKAITAADLLAHVTVYRDQRLASLSQEELAALDALARKLALAPPDAPQNQIESKPAIEAEIVESKA